MNSGNETIRCQNCGQQVPVYLMFKHKIDECNPLPDINNPLLIQQTNSVIQENREQRQPTQITDQRSKIRLSNQRGQQQNQRPQNGIIQQDPQRQQQRTSSQNMSESQILRLIVVCDFCQEEYSKDTYEEHLTVCEQKKIIEGLQNDLYIEDELNQDNQRQRAQEERQQQQNQPRGQRNRRNRSTNESPDHIQDIFGPIRANIFPPPQQRSRLPDINSLFDQGFRNIVHEQDNNRRVIRRSNDNRDDSFDRFINIMRTHEQLVNLPNFAFGNLIQTIQRPPQRVSQDRINEQITIEFKKSQGLSEEHTKCSICMADYEENEKLILLECTHRYHKSCIEEWMKNSYFCPICKFDIRRRNNQQEEDDEEDLIDFQ